VFAMAAYSIVRLPKLLAPTGDKLLAPTGDKLLAPTGDKLLAPTGEVSPAA
jgi:hypothetical protein